MIQPQLQSTLRDKTEGFVGREYVFAAIEGFLRARSSGYFIIEADPGAGKSAILAEYARRTSCVVHFNERPKGITGVRQFLDNIQSQISQSLGLPRSPLPEDANQYGHFLHRLLTQASARLGAGNRLVIAVDALDEVDLGAQAPGTNVLYLPPLLPERVFFVLTRRNVSLPFVAHAPQQLLELMKYHEESLKDIQTRARLSASRPRIREWLEKQALTVEQFVEVLGKKSDNNFMFLRYILQDIESGVYQDLNLEQLPHGLMGYYEDHWARMGMTAKPRPDQKIKIVYVLAEIRGPVSRDLIARFAGEHLLAVQEVLDEWRQFLHEQQGEQHILYSIYHTSFRDFLHGKKVVQAAGISLEGINAMIAVPLWEQLLGRAPRKPAPTGPVAPKPVELTLRLRPGGDHVQILWEAHVLGRHESRFRPPYQPATLSLVLKALSAAQYSSRPQQGPQFSAPEKADLGALGLWEGDRVAGDIHRRVGHTLYSTLVEDKEALVALHTVRNHATAQGVPWSYLLRFPPDAVEIAALPWELLWDAQAFLLMERGQLGSCVRYLDLPYALPPPRPTGTRLHLLAIAPRAQIADSLHAKEKAAREEAWSGLVKAGLVTQEELRPATPTALIDRMQVGEPPDIIHFYGHGRYQGGKGALLFDTSEGGETWLAAEQLATLLSRARLVTLHACWSSTATQESLLTGVAPALSAAGVPAIVAMQLPIRGRAAIRFSSIVYRGLAQGEPLQHAVGQARQALFAEPQFGTSWYVPTVTIRAQDTGAMRLVADAHLQ